MLMAIDWLTVKETAERFNVSEKTIRNWMDRRLLPHFRIGRAVRFRAADIEQHLQTKCRVEVR
jgi:excisionase family DNA binding protein